MTDRGSEFLSAALEAYFTRLDQGEQPDPEEFLRRYPECAEELRGVFTDLAFLQSRIDVHTGSPPAVDGRDELLALEVGGKGSNGSSGSFGTISPNQELGDLGRPAVLPRLRGYEVLDELGSGSQGVVYKAKQLSTQRLVALKVVRHGALASGPDRRRFENEVQLASRLRHPNIVAVYDGGCDSGRDFFAMEYVEGEPLDLYCSRNDLPIARAVRLFLTICRAVSYAHQQGVIHRDLKPSNVLVDANGDAHILDFGLAKPVPGSASLVDSTLTHVGDFAGTWSYASPEQVRMDPVRVDVRSDVYTLGVILYEMLTDCSPYPAPTATSRDSIIRNILKTPPLPPSAILRDVDGDLEAIVLKALSKDPDRRYQSAAAYADDLERYLNGDVIEARRAQSWHVLSRLLRRHRWQFGGLAAALFVLIAFTVIVSILYSREWQARETANLQMNLIRDSQSYTYEKLDELNHMSNTVHAALESGRFDIWSDRYLEPRITPAILAAEWGEDQIPREIQNGVFSQGNTLSEGSRDWLERNEPRLARTARILNENAVVFPLGPGVGDGSAFDQHPLNLDVAQSIVQCLIARGLDKDGAGRFAEAGESFAAAREIALGLGDGRLLHQKLVSCSLRKHLCSVVRGVLERRRADPSTADPYLQWVRSDPPVPTLRFALIAERGRLVHAIVGASVGDPRQSGGQLDLDKLDRLTFGFLETSGALTEDARRLAASLRPRDALSALDFYIQEMEGWDGLSVSELDARVREANQTLQSFPAWRLLRTLVPDLTNSFRVPIACRVERCHMMALSSAFGFFKRVGRWPASADEIAAFDGLEWPSDPRSNLPFQFRLEDGLPVVEVPPEPGIGLAAPPTGGAG